jgi:hypothetical protein
VRGRFISLLTVYLLLTAMEKLVKLSYAVEVFAFTSIPFHFGVFY